MLHVALLCLFVGQIPPPPRPLLPQSNAQSSAESALTDPKAQREWLITYLAEQMEAQGKLDAKKHREIEKMVNNVQDRHLGKLIRYYQDRKAQANLGRSLANGDSLNWDLQWRIAISRQEQAQGDMQYSPRLDFQQPPWAMENFNAAPIQDVYTIQPWQYPVYTIQPWQYPIYRPHYYMPSLHYRHHR
jgi:hypothetical protein